MLSAGTRWADERRLEPCEPGGRVPDVIDLHCHTRFSDGSLTPTQLIELAVREGLSAVAVTDHDTVDGLGEALAAGERLGIEVVPGIEINLEHDQVTMDLLGYFLAGRPSEELREQLVTLRAYRDERNSPHPRAPRRPRLPGDPRGARRHRRRGRRRASAHRRGDAAPRLRALGQRSVRALPAPRRPRLGRPAAPCPGPCRAPAARVGRRARDRPSRHHPRRPPRPRPDRPRRRQGGHRRPRVPLPEARPGDRRLLSLALHTATASRPPAAPTSTATRSRRSGSASPTAAAPSPTSCSRGCAATPKTPSAARPRHTDDSLHPGNGAYVTTCTWPSRPRSKLATVHPGE